MKKTIKLTESDLTRLVKQIINEQNEKWVKTVKKRDDGDPDTGKIMAATMNIQNLIEKKGWLPGEYNLTIDKPKRELKSCKTKHINGEEYIDTTSCITVRY